MQGWLDFLYAKKAWVGAVVAAVGNVVVLVQTAVADEAITFDEAEGIVMAAVAVLTTLGVFVGVFKATNSHVPRPPVT